MLHDLFGSKRDFQRVGVQMSKDTGFPVFAIDVRNHGSCLHGREHTYMAMAEDMIRCLKEKEWPGREKPILCGHGMGAKTAMLVALMEPDLISKLIIIDNAPVSQKLDQHHYDHLAALMHIESNHKELIYMKPQVRIDSIDLIMREYEPNRKLREWLYYNIRTVIKNVAEKRLPKTMVRIPVYNFKEDDVLGKLGEWPQEVANKKFEKPKLILKSNFLNLITSRDQFTANFPNNVYETYDCSHWLFSELPDKFISDVSKFLDYMQEK